jgi:hypothetical protein
MNGMTSQRRPASGAINVALGIWLIISPFVLGFEAHQAAKWNDIAVGIAVGLVALQGWSAFNVALGVWLIIAPFVLGFANLPTLLWNSVILGALVGIVAFTTGSSHRAEPASPPPA